MVGVFSNVFIMDNTCVRVMIVLSMRIIKVVLMPLSGVTTIISVSMCMILMSFVMRAGEGETTDSECGGNNKKLHGIFSNNKRKLIEGMFTLFFASQWLRY